MAALEPQHTTVLKKVLAERFAQFLPPLLGASKPEDQAAKQLSRAFSAFVLPNLRDIHTAADTYPRKRLLDYLSGKAPHL